MFNDCRLYVVGDTAAAGGRPPTEVLALAAEGGADVVQLREKTAAAEQLHAWAVALREITRRLGVLFIVNDRADVALAVEADGVHAGQEDVPAAALRRLLGRRRLLGISTHSVEQARAAAAAGADYISVGPIFPTPTKPTYGAVGLELLRAVRRAVSVPLVAIGGIDASNVDRVLDAGAERVAVVRAVVGAPDVAGAARALKDHLVRRRPLRGDGAGGPGTMSRD